MYFKEDRLTDLCVRIFLDCGMSETAARQNARVLIAADFHLEQELQNCILQ